MFYTGVKKMNNKIFIILFFLFALISVSAVSAADADGNNDTIVSSANAEILSAANDVNAIDDLNKDDSDSEAVLGNAVKSSAAGEKEILSVENSGSDVVGATGTTITSVNVTFQGLTSKTSIKRTNDQNNKNLFNQPKNAKNKKKLCKNISFQLIIYPPI